MSPVKQSRLTLGCRKKDREACSSAPPALVSHAGGVHPSARLIRLSALICAFFLTVPAGFFAVPILCAQSKVEIVEIDTKAAGSPFPHYWERMFGSGRAILSLRASYRRDLGEVKRATGMEYVRFHGILDDEVGVYDEDAHGRPIYNFSYVDQIYDGLLQHGVRPFVELSFMPKKLAARQIVHPFWYKPIVSPPKDWAKWGDLVSQFAKHLVERYGIQEVSQWYFEVWNEPNLDFWAGVPKEQTYYHLYDVTARALKAVDSRLRVGGPATAQAKWVGRFIRHCVKDHVPLDFVSTHIYGNDSGKNVFGTEEKIPITQMVCRAAQKVHDEVKASVRPDLPIIWSEYNASFMNESAITDSAFMGPWLADTIRQCDGLADMMSYWTFSDVFVEHGVVKEPFYGGFGLIAADGLPKASFNAFKLLHQLGNRRIPVDSKSVLATRRADGTLVLAVWNLTLPKQRGESKDVRIFFKGLAGSRSAVIYHLDPMHGSVLTKYKAMGSPRYPTRAQIVELRQAAELPPPVTRPLQHGQITLMLPPKGLALIEVRQ